MGRPRRRHEARTFVRDELAASLQIENHGGSMIRAKRAYLEVARPTLVRVGNACDVGYATVLEWMRHEYKAPHSATAQSRHEHIVAYSVCRGAFLTEARLATDAPAFERLATLLGVHDADVASPWDVVLLALRRSLRRRLEADAETSETSSATKVFRLLDEIGVELTRAICAEWAGEPTVQRVVRASAERERRARDRKRRRHAELTRRRRQRR